MATELPLEFEQLNPFGTPRERGLYRAKVPGGWLILLSDKSDDAARAWGMGALTFIPDPEHEWEGGSLPD